MNSNNDTKKEIDETMLLLDELQCTADFIDTIKGGEDMTLVEASVLAKAYDRTGKLFELIRVVYNLGFFRGINWKFDHPGTTWQEINETA